MADLKPGLAARVSICNHKSKICNRFSIAPTVGLKSDAVASSVVLRHERHLVQRCRFKLHGESGVPILLVRLSCGFANLRDRVAPSFVDHHKPATRAGTVVVDYNGSGPRRRFVVVNETWGDTVPQVCEAARQPHQQNWDARLAVQFESAALYEVPFVPQDH